MSMRLIKQKCFCSLFPDVFYGQEVFCTLLMRPRYLMFWTVYVAENLYNEMIWGVVWLGG